MHRQWLALLVLVTACQDTEGIQATSPGDRATYEAYVHPILEARCATIDCHGDPGRPLRLYAETGLRAADALRGQPLGAAEIEGNLRSLAAIDPGAAPAASELVSRPLAGGLAHEGGDLWQAESENQVVCVRAWLAGTSATAACEAALAEPDVMLRDP